MKKTLILVASLLIGSLSVLAADMFDTQVIYWQVDKAAIGEFFIGKGAKFATLFASFDAESDAVQWDTILISETPGSWPGNVVGSSSSTLGSTTTPPDWSQASFYVELWNEKAETLGHSTSVSYTDLLAMEAVTRDLNDFHDETSARGFWRPNSFVVPEPTSGLLFLFGLAGLALRRKRA